MRVAIQKWTVIDDLLITFSTAGRIPDDNIERLITDLRTKPITKYLGTAIGPVEVTSLHRKNGVEVLKRKRISVVVVSDETIIRGVVTALSWLGADAKSYSWTQIREAIQHLKVPSFKEDRVIQAIAELRKACEAEARG